MRGLIVFNTYSDKMKHFSTYGDSDYSIASLEEGVGRIDTKGNEKFDLIVFDKSQVKQSPERYLSELSSFYKGLKEYDLVDESTTYH